MVIPKKQMSWGWTKFRQNPLPKTKREEVFGPQKDSQNTEPQEIFGRLGKVKVF